MMSELPLQIPLNDGILEARLSMGWGVASTLWLIGHPHPLNGGSMSNNKEMGPGNPVDILTAGGY
ncbi:MAG: hypothetical protein JW797_03500 [Bradymonadales bacterium]|nr:hypothetical protein [Bradymonadales bacterium]